MTRFRRRYRVGRRVSWPGRSPGRWIVVALGLGLIVLALAGATGPYRQTLEYRGAIDCERGSAGCLDSGPGSVVDRRVYTTTSTSTDSNGHTSTTTTTHHEITWEAADGSRQAREVSSDFYAKAQQGEPVTLKRWHGQVVGVEVMGGAQWFLPEAGSTLKYWLHLAFLGLGVLLWGLLLGWWDGLFLLAFRTFAWMFMSFVPVGLAVSALAYGLDTGAGFVMQVVFGVFAIGVAGAMLIGSLDSW